MACNITHGRVEPCKDAMAGLRNIYFINEQIDANYIYKLNDGAGDFYILDDDFIIYNEGKYVKSKSGEMFGFSIGEVHRAEYTGKQKYGRILDIAFGENDEGDITRIEDKYGR